VDGPTTGKTQLCVIEVRAK